LLVARDDGTGSVNGELCGNVNVVLLEGIAIGEDIGTAVKLFDIGRFMGEDKSESTATGD